MITTFFQENGRLNMVLPGSRLPFKKEIRDIFRLAIAKLIQNKHFSRVFPNIDMQPIFANRANLKKLVVRTKVV